MPYYEQPDFNPGGVKDRVDNRDHLWSEIGFGSAPFDWNKGFDIEYELGVKIPVKDQNGSGSCGGQAWSYLGAALEARFTQSFEERSAKFIYAQTYVPPAGSAGRDNCNIVIKQGWAREAVLPSYENGNPPTEAFMQRSQDITDPIRQDASKAKGLSYALVNTDIDSVAQALRDNFGVVIGVDGFNNGTWGSAFPTPPKQTPVWRHWLWVCKAKMINGKKYIGVLNSWGTAAGDNGLQWLSEDYFTSYIAGEKCVWSAWTVVYNPQDPDPDFSHEFLVNLNFGESGSEVKALQQALQVDGVFPLNVPCTGYYGDVTRRAVYKFQVKYKVAPMSELNSLNGKVVGQKTRAKLNELFNK